MCFDVFNVFSYVVFQMFLGVFADVFCFHLIFYEHQKQCNSVAPRAQVQHDSFHGSPSDANLRQGAGVSADVGVIAEVGRCSICLNFLLRGLGSQLGARVTTWKVMRGIDKNVFPGSCTGHGRLPSLLCTLCNASFCSKPCGEDP